MKIVQVIVLEVATFIVAASTNAWSQPGQPAGAPVSVPGTSAMSAPGTVSPANEKKADRALRGKIYAAIGKRKEISAGNISIIAKDGVVTLHGTVTDAFQIDQVVEIAKGVPGVTSVVNKLTVQQPLGGM